MSQRQLPLPSVTPSVRALAESRLLTGVALVKHRQKLTATQRRQIKLALLLVHDWNPFEDLTCPEEALLRGLTEDTFTNRRQLKPGHPDALRRL